jgi:hypothetical protein
MSELEVAIIIVLILIVLVVLFQTLRVKSNNCSSYGSYLDDMEWMAPKSVHPEDELLSLIERDGYESFVKREGLVPGADKSHKKYAKEAMSKTRGVSYGSVTDHDNNSNWVPNFLNGGKPRQVRMSPDALTQYSENPEDHPMTRRSSSVLRGNNWDQPY